MTSGGITKIICAGVVVITTHSRIYATARQAIVNGADIIIITVNRFVEALPAQAVIRSA